MSGWVYEHRTCGEQVHAKLAEGFYVMYCPKCEEVVMPYALGYKNVVVHDDPGAMKAVMELLESDSQG